MPGWDAMVQAEVGGSMPEERWVPRTRSDWLLVLGIVLVAFLVRAVPVIRGGGLEGYLGYDDGVYFAAATALVDGVLPYRDFLLLHPPGIAVLLSPFALLAGVTDSATGFAAARLAFMAIGAVNAGLVTVVAGRLGGVPRLSAAACTRSGMPRLAPNGRRSSSARRPRSC